MLYKSLIATVLTIGLTSGAYAAVDLQKLRQAEKISLALTGKPLPADLRAKFVNDQITLEAIADQLSSNADFIEYFAQFWTRLLGTQSPLDVYLWKTPSGATYQEQSFRRNWSELGTTDQPKMNVDYLTKVVTNHGPEYPVEITLTLCKDAPLIVMNASDSTARLAAAVVASGKGPDGVTAIQAGTLPLWQKILDIAKASTATCDDSVVTVKPWWDPDHVTTSSTYLNVASYKVPQAILDRCGPAMIKCNLRNANSYDRFMDTVGKDMSMEPGYIISHVVAADKPFGDVVTTPNTIYTGTYAYFMGGEGKQYWKNFPGQTIPDINNAIFTNGNIWDRKHYWINRGTVHAGVLTTPAFQILTNGRRAKANRAYEGFLCKKFTVPDGAQADPSDANPDLTKRAYCAFCHKSIEPMAAFFNRWPLTGVNNFIYDNTKDVDDTGRYNGQQGVGVAAFGKILIEADGFDECSLRRAFEFVNGRKMTSVEMENILPTYVADFRNAQKSLRTSIKAMVLSPDFLTPKAGGL